MGEVKTVKQRKSSVKGKNVEDIRHKKIKVFLVAIAAYDIFATWTHSIGYTA